MVIMLIIINNLPSGVVVEGRRSLTHFSLLCFYLKYYNRDNIITFPPDAISLQLYLPSAGRCPETPPLRSASRSYPHSHSTPEPRLGGEKEKRKCVTPKSLVLCSNTELMSIQTRGGS